MTSVLSGAATDDYFHFIIQCLTFSTLVQRASTQTEHLQQQKINKMTSSAPKYSIH